MGSERPDERQFSEASAAWSPFHEGRTIGQVGSEDGLILLDEHHSGGARLTLEHETFPAPYTITCNIYGWYIRTHYFATEADAKAAFDGMKPAISGILSLIEEGALDADTRFLMVSEALRQFSLRFPEKPQ